MTVESGARSVTRSIRVRPGATATVTESLVSGWLAIFSQIPLEVHVDGRRIGTTDDEQLMLAPGPHLVTLVNTRFNYSETKALEVRSGYATPYNVSLPLGVVHVSGLPGTEIWVEGERVGEAPIWNVNVPIGTREIVARHPTLGERRETIEVRHGEPAEVTITFATE